jgi:dephospho-CoA kinase
MQRDTSTCKGMRELIFTDPGRKQRLEAILHPAIRERVQEQLRALHSEYCLLVVPLLAESGSGRWGDRVLVVDVDEETQLARVMARDQIGRKQALAILNSQATRQQRLALADDVIHNYGSLAELDRAVHALHDQYLELARLRQPGAGRGPLDSGMRRNDAEIACAFSPRTLKCLQPWFPPPLRPAHHPTQLPSA